MIPADTVNTPAIQILWSRKNHEDSALHQVLNLLSKPVESGSETVLLIGRYNWNCPDGLASLKRRYSNFSIAFKSIHSSKGLEADHVVILNAKGGRHGLPSQVLDDSLLDMVLPRQESFENAEEHRVFYVALTRARRSVTIIANEDQPSSFVDELLDEKEYDVIEIGAVQLQRYTCVRCGGHLHRKANNRYVCEHWDNCDANLPSCIKCKNNLPIRKKTASKVNQCMCGAEFPACSECPDGWLIERNGKYGLFLSCSNWPTCDGSQSIKRGNRKAWSR